MADDPRRSKIPEVDAERLREITNRLISVLTSPEFIEQARSVYEAPEKERLVVASQRLSVDALRSLGLDLPDDFRVSSRYFESDWPTAIEFGDYPEGRNPINVRNEKDPGELDRLRLEDPDSFWRTVIEGRRPEALQLGTSRGETETPGEIAFGVCGGGGKGDLCGCAGFST
jgi:hypothetical protein